MNALQQSALAWTNEGVAVIPIAFRDKRPVIPAWREFQDRLPTRDELRRWFQTRLRNLAVITGWGGLAVLDFDNIELYNLWYAWATAGRNPARHTYQVQTRRGRHVYLRIDEPVQSGKVGAIDVKAGGGYVLAPPSIHPSGHHYTVINDAPIVRLAQLSEALPLMPTAETEPVAAVSLARGEPHADPFTAALHPLLPPDELIGAILAQHSVLELFPTAHRKGGRFWAACPLHNDSNPSVSIDLDGRRARCWAGCTDGHGWDYLDWYCALHACDLSVAIRRHER